MESVLERAIEHAAELMTHRLYSVSPDVMALAGAPRAQGFRLDGYGLFFAVEVPRLSDSMNWALRVLGERHDERTLASLRRLADAQTDAALRADIERAMRLIEMQAVGQWSPPPPAEYADLRPAPGPGGALRPEGGAVPTASGAPAPPRSAPAPRSQPTASAGPGPTRDHPVNAAQSMDDDSAPTARGGHTTTPSAEDHAGVVTDPSVAYEDEVTTALIDAILDYSLSLPLAPGEWVTVAARDAGFVAFPDAVAEMVTVTLSVRVDDLLEYRAQRISRDEVRSRVLVREF
jgi:hypothetical protein